MRTRWQTETIDIVDGHLHITVRPHHIVQGIRSPARIHGAQEILELMAIDAIIAAHAHHRVAGAMQLEYLATSGLGVQAIHVLRDQRLETSLPLKAGQCVMHGIRLMGGEPRPAYVIASPVASPHLRRLYKLLVLNGLTIADATRVQSHPG